MQNRIRVGHAELAALGEGLRRASDGIAAELSALDDEAAALRCHWTGSAARAYDDAHAQWTRELDRMSSILLDAVALAARAAEAHRDAEAEVAALW